MSQGTADFGWSQGPVHSRPDVVNTFIVGFPVGVVIAPQRATAVLNPGLERTPFKPEFADR